LVCGVCVIFLRRALLFFTILLASAAPALSQYRTSTISGVVRTGDGQPVPDVQIQDLENGRAVSAVTDTNGKFLIYFVTPGNHKIVLKHASIPEMADYDATIDPGEALDLEVVLDRGSSSGTINTWTVRKTKPKTPNPWQPLRYITPERIESLPSTEHLESFLNQTEPWVVADQYDPSGLESQHSFKMGLQGSSWTQNPGLINGITISHPRSVPLGLPVSAGIPTARPASNATTVKSALA
jgi:hypothetical protein